MTIWHYIKKVSGKQKWKILTIFHLKIQTGKNDHPKRVQAIPSVVLVGGPVGQIN